MALSDALRAHRSALAFLLIGGVIAVTSGFAFAAMREREPIVAALDQVYCQLDALDSRPRHADPGAAWQDKA